MFYDVRRVEKPSQSKQAALHSKNHNLVFYGENTVLQQIARYPKQLILLVGVAQSLPSSSVKR